MNLDIQTTSYLRLLEDIKIRRCERDEIVLKKSKKELRDIQKILIKRE